MVKSAHFKEALEANQQLSKDQMKKETVGCFNALSTAKLLNELVVRQLRLVENKRFTPDTIQIEHGSERNPRDPNQKLEYTDFIVNKSDDSELGSTFRLSSSYYSLQTKCVAWPARFLGMFKSTWIPCWPWRLELTYSDGLMWKSARYLRVNKEKLWPCTILGRELYAGDSPEHASDPTLRGYLFITNEVRF